MLLTSPVGLTSPLVWNREALLDQDHRHVALGSCERRQSPSIAVGAAGPLDRNRAIEELAQPAGGDQALGEFRVAPGPRDLGRVRLDEADPFTRQFDRIAIDNPYLIASDHLGPSRVARQA